MKVRFSHVRVVAVTAFLFCCVLTANGQFTITIPGIPKIKKKDKPEPTPTPAPVDNSSSSDTGGNSSSSSSSPSISSEPEPPPAKTECKDMPVFQVLNEDVQKTMDQAREYRPGLRDYYVEDFNDNHNIYLKAALNAQERKDFFGSDPSPTYFKCMNPRLDELAAVAEKTIVTYKPTGYTIGTPAEKNILRSGVTDLNKAAVFQVGTNSATWKIFKNDYGIPTRRKRFGTIWAKYPGDKYCKIIYVNLVQEYSGGGTYGASDYQFITWEYAGCPAGK